VAPVPRFREAVAGETPAEGAAPAPSSDEAAACRIGLLLDGLVQERWVVDTVRATLEVPGTCLAAIAVAAHGRSGSVASRLHRALDAVDGRLRCRHERPVGAARLTPQNGGALRVKVESAGRVRPSPQRRLRD
jgi:hypothetical protein